MRSACRLWSKRRPWRREALVQRALARVAEGRMADVVNQCQCLGEIFVQAKSGCGGSGNLRDLDRVGQTAAKVIGRPARKDLGLPSQPAKGTRLHNPFAIALKGRARGARGRRIDARQQQIVRIPGDAQRWRSIAILRS